MLKLILSLLTAITLVFNSLTSFALSADHVLINEIQTNGLNSTGATLEEFVEIHNPTDQTVNVSGWQLRYVSSSGSLLTAKTFFTLPDDTILYANGFITLAPDGYLTTTPGVYHYSTSSFSGLSFDGATVDLLDATGELIDRVGWGTKTTILGENALAPAPARGQSIERKIDDGQAVDSDNNANDFQANINPSPATGNNQPTETSGSNQESEPTPPTDDTDPNADNQPGDISGETAPPPTNNTPDPTDPPAEQVAEPLLPIKLNELLIDPASPLSDSYDEWVELYNPNPVAVSLKDYQVITGQTGSYKFTFVDQTIEPLGYLVIWAKDTPISLSNNGGKVVLLDSAGVELDSVTYDKAETGYAYAKNNEGAWQWTTTPTALASNVFTYPITASALTAAKLATKKAKSTKKASSSTKAKATVKKAAAKKQAKSKAAKKSTTVSGANDSTSKQLASVPTPLPNNLLALLAVLAILYSCYEYRFEIRNKIRQFKSYRAARR